MTLSWYDAVKAALERQSKKYSIITNKNLIKEELPQIIKDTNTKGKTPDKTLSYYLQSIRDNGELRFLDRGKYELITTTKKSKICDTKNKIQPVSKEHIKNNKPSKYINETFEIKYIIESIEIE